MPNRTCWLAAAYYLLASVALTMWLWRDPASHVAAVNPYDADQFAWFFRYDATAAAHLRLPGLVSAGMNAPRGFNLMWNTPMFLPGVVLAPLTLLAGPQASLTLLLTLGFAGSALAMFVVLRGWGASTVAAACGGFVYGFSPAVVQSALGHYDLQFAVLPPLIVDAALRLATGRVCHGRVSHAGGGAHARRNGALRWGAWLGTASAAQIFLAEELLFDSAVTVVILLAVLTASRPRAVADALGTVAAGAAAAAAVTGALAGYPLWEQFLGPIREHGSPFAPDFYKNDLAGFVQPPGSLLLHTRSSAAFASAFQGQPPEYLAYLGWPMLILITVVTVVYWRRLPVRAPAVTFAMLSALSLGGTLLAGGHEHSWLKLPWYWAQTLPVAGSVIPDRFSILADGAAAAAFAFGLDAALARWPAARRPAENGPDASWSALSWPRARWAVAGIAIVALAPLIPRPLPAGSVSTPPAGWTAALAALRLPATAPVLVVPVPMSSFTEPLRWAADTGMPSSVIGGYFTGPKADGRAAPDGDGPPPADLYLNRLWTRPDDLAARTDSLLQASRYATALRAQLTATGAAAVVADTSARSALGTYLTSVLGSPTVQRGQVLGWRLTPHHP
jgi:hypothetical protein